jgi:hypothetical protein
VSDGNLRSLIQQKMPDVHFQAIETGGTGLGIPDLNGCVDGVETWTELKFTTSWRVKVRPQQVAWLERRERAGGRCFILTRQGGRDRDTLWLTASSSARLLIEGTRLDLLPPPLILGHWEGGPARWGWGEVRQTLFGGGIPPAYS